MTKTIKRLFCMAMALCLLLCVLPAAFASGGEDTAETLTASAGYYFAAMNIPYADFYTAELTGNETEVDAVSSATMTKTLSESIVGGSYHVDPAGSDITGITYTVAIPEDADLSGYVQVTDDTVQEFTTTSRSKETTTELVGQDALFQNESYAYYVLDEDAAVVSYKVLTVEEDGTLSFSAAVSAVEETLEDATAKITTNTNYGDYEVDVTSDVLSKEVGVVYAVVLNTAEGESYGLRHLENIWHVTSLAWSVSASDSHGASVSYEPYEDIVGQTITSIVYYTDIGILTIETSLTVPA